MKKRFLFSALPAAFIFATPKMVMAAPVPDLYQKVNNGVSLGVVVMNQDYKERGVSATTTGSSFSGVLDKESGNIGGLSLSGYAQKSHLGGAFSFRYLKGDTAYDGHSLYDGSPLSGTTSNEFMDMNFVVDYSHSPDNVPRLAVTPGVELGYSIWKRDLGDGTSETYSHGYYMGKVGLNYSLSDKLLVEAGYGAGRTVSPGMHLEKAGSHSYSLGASDISSVWFKGTLILKPGLNLFAKYQRMNFKYKASGVLPDGTKEPDSETKHTYVSVGFGYYF